MTNDNTGTIKNLLPRFFKSTNPNTIKKIYAGENIAVPNTNIFKRVGEKFLEIPMDGIVSTNDPEIIYAIFGRLKQDFMNEDGHINEITSTMIKRKNKAGVEIGIYTEEQIERIKADIKAGKYNFTPRENIDEVKIRLLREKELLDLEELSIDNENRKKKIAAKKAEK